MSCVGCGRHGAGPICADCAARAVGKPESPPMVPASEVSALAIENKNRDLLVAKLEAEVIALRAKFQRSAGEWVPVTERLPEVGVWVLAHWIESGLSAHVSDLAVWTGKVWDDGEDHFDPIKPPSHWLEIKTPEGL